MCRSVVVLPMNRVAFWAFALIEINYIAQPTSDVLFDIIKYASHSAFESNCLHEINTGNTVF